MGRAQALIALGAREGSRVDQEQGRGRERHGTLWGPNAVKQQQELEALCSLLQ